MSRATQLATLGRSLFAAASRASEARVAAYSARARAFSSYEPAAEGTYLDKGAVTERVVEVVKAFGKIDPAKVCPTLHVHLKGPAGHTHACSSGSACDVRACARASALLRADAATLHALPFLAPRQVTPEAHFTNDLGLDSLDTVEVRSAEQTAAPATQQRAWRGREEGNPKQRKGVPGRALCGGWRARSAGTQRWQRSQEAIAAAGRRPVRAEERMARPVVACLAAAKARGSCSRPLGFRQSCVCGLAPR